MNPNTTTISHFTEWGFTTLARNDPRYMVLIPAHLVARTATPQHASTAANYHASGVSNTPSRVGDIHFAHVGKEYVKLSTTQSDFKSLDVARARAIVV